MKAQAAIIPNLRFSSFDGTWGTKRLGDLCSTFKSGSGITSSEIADQGDFPVYGGNGLRGYTDTFTHEGFYFLIGRQGALCGNINRVRKKSFISEHAIAVQGNGEADTEWLAQRLDYFNLNRLSESSAQPGLSVGKLARLKITLPPLPEQRKIADFLTAVDGRIGKLIQKKALLVDYKKGVMQQLFTQAIRFKDDQGNDFPDWEEKRLGKVATCLDNLRRPVNATEREKVKGDIPYYGANGIQGYVNDFIFDEDLTLLAEDGGNFDEFTNRPIAQRVTGKAWVNNHAHILRANPSDMTPAFLFHSLVHKDIRKYINGTSRAKLNKGDMLTIVMTVPDVPEQTKIADFLSAIDRKIESVASQIIETQTFKRGLLQQMFV